MKNKSSSNLCRAIVQLSGTLAIIFLLQNTILITISLLIWWAITFYPLTKVESLLFVLTCIIFTIVDISVLQQGIFVFHDQDVLGMPYFEIFMWGFYFLHAARFIQGEISDNIKPGLFFSALVFSALSFISNVTMALSIVGVLIVGALFYFGTKKDVQYTFYVMCMGLIIEQLGTLTGTWSYAIDNYYFWWMITWAASGLILYRTILPITKKLFKYL